MKVKDRGAKFLTDFGILLLGEELVLVLAEIVAVETALERERVSYHELLPGNDSSSAELVGLDFEAAVAIVEEVSLLGHDARQEADDGPAEEATVGRCVAAIEEAVLLLRVSVEIAIYPNLSALFLGIGLQQLLDSVDLGVVVFVWRDPLAVEVHS